MYGIIHDVSEWLCIYLLVWYGSKICAQKSKWNLSKISGNSEKLIKVVKSCMYKWESYSYSWLAGDNKERQSSWYCTVGHYRVTVQFNSTDYWFLSLVKISFSSCLICIWCFIHNFQAITRLDKCCAYCLSNDKTW